MTRCICNEKDFTEFGTESNILSVDHTLTEVKFAHVIIRALLNSRTQIRYIHALLNSRTHLRFFYEFHSIFQLKTAKFRWKAHIYLSLPLQVRLLFVCSLSQDCIIKDDCYLYPYE